MKKIIAVAFSFVAVCAFPEVPPVEGEAQNTVSLEAGFSPDPEEVELTGGGEWRFTPSEADAEVMEPDSVSGMFDGGMVREDGPNLSIDWQGSDEDLHIGWVGYYRPQWSRIDAFLLVRGPEGEWWVADSQYGSGFVHPAFAIENAPSGSYDVWVGSFGEDMLDGVVLVSGGEIDTLAQMNKRTDY